MRHRDENDTVNSETGEISAGANYANWLNGSGKEEFIRLCHTIQGGEMTPALLRYALEQAFMAGAIVTRAQMLAQFTAVAASSPPIPAATVQADSALISHAESADLTCGGAAA